MRPAIWPHTHGWYTRALKPNGCLQDGWWLQGKMHCSFPAGGPMRCSSNHCAAALIVSCCWHFMNNFWRQLWFWFCFCTFKTRRSYQISVARKQGFHHFVLLFFYSLVCLFSSCCCCCPCLLTTVSLWHSWFTRCKKYIENHFIFCTS